MSNNRVEVSAPGLPLTALLITFVVLKLTHVIDWSWWWVLSPFWIPVALFAVGFFLLALFAVIKSLVTKK